MDKYRLMRIEDMERQLAKIDDRIRELEREREDVLQSDEEYANYVNYYRVCYNDPPQSIRRYYELSAELGTINQAFQAPQADAEELMQYYGRRLQYLERVLAA